MAEAQAAAEQTPAASTPAETPKQETTLDDVYKTYKVEEMAQEFKASPKQEPKEESRQEPVVSVPDPVLDKPAYDAFLKGLVKDASNSKQALRKLETQLQERDRAAFQEREEADIRKAVSKVNDHLGEAKLPDDFVEVALGVEAKRDPRFFTVWNNRTKNPQAFDAAVKAFAGKLCKQYSLRADPQIAENQRALREATSTKATTAPEPTQDEKLGKLQGAAFQRAMDRIKRNESPF